MTKLKALHTLHTFATNLFTLPTPPPPECTCIRDILQHTKQQEAQLKVSNGFLQDRVEVAEKRAQYYKDKTKRLRKGCHDLRITVQILKAREGMQPRMKHKQEPVSQTKPDSRLEAFANFVTGYCLAVLSQIILFPLFHVHLSLFDHLLVGLVFTVISVIRGHCLRRRFNRRTVRNA